VRTASATHRTARRLLFPVAWATEFGARLGVPREPQVTVDALRMARKKMYFDSARAQSELGYASRPALEAIADALAWLREAGLVT